MKPLSGPLPHCVHSLWPSSLETHEAQGFSSNSGNQSPSQGRLGRLLETTHTPLLPADGQVQVQKGEHCQALSADTVPGEVCHLLQLLQLLWGGRWAIALLCHTSKQTGS